VGCGIYFLKAAGRTCVEGVILIFDDFLKQESLVVPYFQNVISTVCRPRDSLITFFFCGVPGDYDNRVRKNGFLTGCCIVLAKKGYVGKVW